MHVASYHLAVALENGYQIVWDPSDRSAGADYADRGCGQQQDLQGFDCYFEQPSACGFQFVRPNNSIQGSFNMSMIDGKMHQGSIPTFWSDRLSKELPFLNRSQAYKRFWWRMQSVAYLMRLNAKTSNELLKLRLDPNLHTALRINMNNSQSVPISVPFPLPSGSINAHVRHGDKGVEMTLVPFAAYARAAQTLVAHNPFYLKSVLFVSSEDEQVINASRSLQKYVPTTPSWTWLVVFSNIHRLNDGPMPQLQKFGKGVMMREWLLQLVMALECDAFIGTLGSNWNRLIFALRCIWVAKCTNIYHDVGHADWSTIVF